MRRLQSSICSLALLMFFLSGCATVMEGARQVAGVSTRDIEMARKNALSEEFTLGYSVVMEHVNDVLGIMKAYPYALDPAKGLTAVYVTELDTTPVGIFVRESALAGVKVEISSRSTYAKEAFAKRIFGRLAKVMKGQSNEEIRQEEKMADK